MINLSLYVESLENKNIAVFGLARSGLSSIEALIGAGAKVYAWDDNADARDKAKELGAQVAPLTQEIVSQCMSLVLAPGVPLHFPEPHDVVKTARQVDVEIISDIELLGREMRARTKAGDCVPKIVGITGTNGKSTTTALLTHVLNNCDIPALMGGNIGVPVMGVDMSEGLKVIVLELSSYQLDLCPTFRPDYAILLNITPDHIDRHGTMEKYTQSKLSMFNGAERGAMPQDLFAAYVDDIHMPKAHVTYILDNIVGIDGVPTLLGAHNMQNAGAVMAAAKCMGASEDDIIAALRTYPGLPHRQFPARKIGNVLYVNDSKATNAEATSKALSSYRNIFLIAGGMAKEGGLNGLEEWMKNIQHSFLIGDAQDEFGEYLKAQKIPYQKLGILERAVKQAHESAQEFSQKTGEDSVVLLSPACASFDQFSSYEERGEKFEQYVRALPDIESNNE